ncbi:MAG TPA: hypothetical protein VHT73_10210 [Thermodesulfobacteriota bacterium]|nr:hypothetical protein [Thermodesulfobacteriota bacterium]
MKQKYEIDYDVRVVERNLRDKVVTKGKYEEYLENLPDVSDEGCPLVIDEELSEEVGDQSTSEEEGE